MKLDTPVEEWRDVVGWEGLYQASSHGCIRSLDRVVEMRNGILRLHKGQLLAPAYDDVGRARVNLCFAGQGNMRLVHRLVAEAFIGPCPEGMEVCHNDGNASHNHVSNLRWDTHLENVQDTLRHGNNSRRVRTHCPRGHELAEWNNTKSAKKRGRRECRACHYAAGHYRKVDPEFCAEADRQYGRIKMRNLCAV